MRANRWPFESDGNSEVWPVAKLLSQIVWTFLFYTILRILFLIWNWQGWYSSLSVSEIARALIIGWRFDISAIFTLSSVVILISLIPWPFVIPRIKQKTLSLAFNLIHVPFLIFNMGDTEFIQFVGRRFSIDSLYLASEVPGKALSIFQTYWFLTLINLSLLTGFIYFNNKISFKLIDKICKFKDSSWLKLGGALIVLILLALGIRGGIQNKPIGLAHAAIFSDPKLNHLALNSSFTFIHSIQQNRLTIRTEYTDEELNSFFPSPKEEAPLFAQPQNIVLLIIESLSAEYVGIYNNGDGFTPFIDELAKKGVYFPWAFANGRRSIEALPSILAGVPGLMEQPFVTSPYQNLNIPLIAHHLNQKGYETLFLHGGNNGTMLFDTFSERLGFNKYIGADEYPNREHYDGVWGIWDEHFLRFSAEEISKLKAPFFTTIFTLSSHHPFKVPVEYDGKFRKGPLPILEVVGYTDHSLQKFFALAQKQDWYKNTLFIITADHTSKSFRPSYQSSLSSFRIPLILYHPSIDLNARLEPHSQGSRLAQQVDILPTILDASLSTTLELPKFGISLLRPSNRPISLFADQSYLMLSDSFVLVRDPNNHVTLFNYRDDPLLNTPLTHPEKTQELNNLLKAHIQYFNNTLLKGSL